MATDTPDLTGRVVIVTGASRGIGKGLAIGFAKLGASVACAARSTADAPGDIPGTINDTLRAIEDAGGRAIAIRCDIGNEDDINHLVDATVAEFGRLDVLMNNAMSPTQALLADSNVGEWDESMRVNVRSLYVFTQAVTPHMVAVGGGSIINMSSHGAAHETTPFMPPGYLVYSVAKAALERFSTAAAPELAPLGIAINALRPGAVKTEMTALEFGEDHDWSGWNTPDAVVPPAAALATKRGDEFTGQIVDVAGYGKIWE